MREENTEYGRRFLLGFEDGPEAPWLKSPPKA